MLLSLLAAHTKKIGLIGTASTTCSLPYTLARQYATLDHFSKGRAGWNIVTSWAPEAGANYGLQQNVGHGDRYKLAEECVEAVDALWKSFPSDAVVDDRDGGAYIDTNRLKPANYEGSHYRTKGPLNVPGSPQGASRLHPGRSIGYGKSVCRTLGRGDIHGSHGDWIGEVILFRRQEPRSCIWPQA